MMLLRRSCNDPRPSRPSSSTACSLMRPVICWYKKARFIPGIHGDGESILFLVVMAYAAPRGRGMGLEGADPHVI